MVDLAAWRKFFAPTPDQPSLTEGKAPYCLSPGRAPSALHFYSRLRDGHGLDSFSPHFKHSGYNHHNRGRNQSYKLEMVIASLNTENLRNRKKRL